MAKSDKGFASMPQNKQEEIAKEGGEAGSSKQDMSKLGRKGGKAAQESGKAHTLTPEEREEGGESSH